MLRKVSKALLKFEIYSQNISQHLCIQAPLKIRHTGLFVPLQLGISASDCGCICRPYHLKNMHGIQDRIKQGNLSYNSFESIFENKERVSRF